MLGRLTTLAPRAISRFPVANIAVRSFASDFFLDPGDVTDRIMTVVKVSFAG